MDFTAILAQKQLQRKSNEELSTQLCDTAIQIAIRMGYTPHAVLQVASGKVGFSEKEWQDEVLPELRKAMEAAA